MVSPKGQFVVQFRIGGIFPGFQEDLSDFPIRDMCDEAGLIPGRIATEVETEDTKGDGGTIIVTVEPVRVAGQIYSYLYRMQPKEVGIYTFTSVKRC